MRGATDLTMIEVQIGTNLVEEDIIRVEKNWDQILLLCDLPDYDAENHQENA
ncbi:hypothetical protein SDC9_174330 [bioreactor metagenome]|uniref:Uncharacterized protein n=1 Tax=bioreactor metagenome TaxID=1076179 RepID=A0A645GSC5_9ZZZZ